MEHIINTEMYIIFYVALTFIIATFELLQVLELPHKKFKCFRNAQNQ
jgi:hypothetical protein